MKQWTLTELIGAVENELREMGYSREAIYKYRALGFTPIKRFYESISQTVYSEKTTQEYVFKAQLEDESGTMYDAKRMTIRKSAVILAEYAKAGEIIWRVLPNWNMRRLQNHLHYVLKNMNANCTRTVVLQQPLETESLLRSIFCIILKIAALSKYPKYPEMLFLRICQF